jgi:uncharacterized protein DUF3303
MVNQAAVVGESPEGYTFGMLFMVIERFKNGDAGPVGERFRRSGRMLPRGVFYHASWVDSAGAVCFQILEAPDRSALDPWIERWNDLVDFEIVPVQTSAEFWAKREA